MRRTPHALSLAAAALGALGALAPTASADPSAEVSPGSAAPGGTVTVSVFCDPAGGPPPKTLEAASAAFDKGVVELKQVTGGDAEESGPAYRGTANIQDVGAAGGPDAVRDRAVTGDDKALDKKIDAGVDDVKDTGSPADGSLDALAAFGALDAVGTAGGGAARTVEGTCPDASGGKGKPWSATYTVVARHPGGSGAPAPSHKSSPPYKPSPSHKSSPPYKPSPSPARSSSPCPGPERAHCGGPEVPRGVQAGTGGGFTDSVPALVTGGLLIAAAFGAAAHRLYRDRSTRTDG
ncbi:hypothetical protein [Streptomyces incanus]|uniref:Secreted protein n=1 Tax=Streptomyces incanus TaxID=887453 RepID=A0ABW0XRI4_9ACTN